MKNRKHGLYLVGALALMPLWGAVSVASGQDQELEPTFYSKQRSDDQGGPQLRAPHPPGVNGCRGPIRMVSDVGFEGVRTTGWNFAAIGGGGEGGRFDPNPLLSTTVTLVQGTCLNAHFSAIVGSRQTYGPAFSALTLFQVTLTPAGGGPQHLFGHYETPYGVYAPAVAIEAERDVDTYGSNFFQRVGTEPGEVPPGVYRVNVWWAGGPIGGGGAIGADFILKLYLY
jgi:hypothetical protein